jgi:hypothetical protein
LEPLKAIDPENPEPVSREQRIAKFGNKWPNEIATTRTIIIILPEARNYAKSWTCAKNIEIFLNSRATLCLKMT